MHHALLRWEGLSRFIDDRRIDIDSNVVERERILSCWSGRRRFMLIISSSPYNWS
jgi:hypothetical protein